MKALYYLSFQKLFIFDVPGILKKTGFLKIYLLISKNLNLRENCVIMKFPVNFYNFNMKFPRRSITHK